jgi:hypothetical protein
MGRGRLPARSAGSWRGRSGGAGSGYQQQDLAQVTACLHELLGLCGFREWKAGVDEGLEGAAGDEGPDMLFYIGREPGFECRIAGF